MKKRERGTAPRRDERRPTKPAAPPAGKPTRPGSGDVAVPSYDGPEKTAKAPSQKARLAGPTKAAWRPSGTRRPRARMSEAERGDQLPLSKGGTTRASGAKEQYVRLRLRVRDDRISVVDSHLVEGPLARSQGFSGANAYEVTVGDRLVHAEAIQDLGVQRSFVNPSGPPEQRGHHLTYRPIYEFTARVPASEVSRETIGKMAVRLHRLKDEVRTDRIGTAPLALQFGRQIRQVAEIVGLPESILPEVIEGRGGRTPSV